MGFTLIGDTFHEDFNYGYPYKLPLQTLPGIFRYSDEVETESGHLTPGYDRASFKLQYSSRKLDGNNTDLGLHGGARNSTGYYLMFPEVDWNESQTLTLRVTTKKDAVLSFFRSWDGFIGDELRLIVNGKTYEKYTHSAGHGWVEHHYPLPKGDCIISWMVQTFLPDVNTRQGITDASFLIQSTLPYIHRIFRLADINIIEVDSITFPRFSYANAVGVGTVTCHSFGIDRAKASLKGLSSLVLGVKTSGPVALIGQSSFITDFQTAIRAKPTFFGTGIVTCFGQVIPSHSSEDAGLVVDTHGEITVAVPPDTVQNISSLVRPFNLYTIQMPRPTLVNGQPILPTYIDEQTSTFSSGGGYTHSTSIPPSSVDHKLPNNALYRWVSIDVTGAIDDPVYAWPERDGGPNLISADPFAPTMHPSDHFAEKDFTYVSYPNVVTFFWRHVQHMWVDLTGHAGVPFTWMFTGIWSPSTKKQWQHVLSSGGPFIDPGSWTNAVDDGDSYFTPVGKEYDDPGTAFFGLYEDGVVLHHQSGKPLYIHGHVDWRPAIYTIVYQAGQTTVYARHRKHKWHHTATSVNNVDGAKFLIGRERNYMGEDYAAHVSMLEIGFWGRALSDKEVLENENYLMGVYQFNKVL